MENYNIYNRRLGRYGFDYKSRIQGEREKLFEELLKKSIYRVFFDYDGEEQLGILEKYKQDDTQTLQYLLTRINVNIPNGTIVKTIDDRTRTERVWMVYWLEDIVASGYNRYIMLKMTHYLTWTARDGSEQSTWAYFYGQEDNMLKDELKSRSRSSTLYTENLKLSFFVAPLNPYIRKDDYLRIGNKKTFEEYQESNWDTSNPKFGLLESYRVTGYDKQSSEGVEYISVDPIYDLDLTPAPEQETENDENFFWLNGGSANGSTGL